MRKFGIILLLFISTTIFAQEDVSPQEALESGTIESQFDYIISNSNKYKNFKVIRKTSILKVKENTLDSLQSVHEDLNSARSSFAKSKSKIKGLEGEIVELNTTVDELTNEKDSISFLGMPISKSAYSTMLWTVILVLLLGLLFFIFQFKSSKMVTNSAKNDLVKLQDELENFRKTALKKEQEIMRKLQDELNKNNH